MTSLILFLDNETHFLIVESLIHRCVDVILLDILLRTSSCSKTYS